MKFLSFLIAVLIVFSGFYVFADVIVQDTLKDGIHRMQLTDAQYKVYLSRALYKKYALKHEYLGSTTAVLSTSVKLYSAK